MTIWLALLGGLAVGGSLGLIGGGGAILAVPLMLALGAEPKPAIAASLLVVAATAGVAALGHARARRVAWDTALLFAPASMLGGYLGGRGAGYVSGDALLLGFALLMLGAAAAMWRPRPAPRVDAEAAEKAVAGAQMRLVAIALLGVAVGAITGLVGAGGGFLFVPVFSLLLGLSMQRAVATSLVVIALNASAALAGHLGHVALDARLAAPVVAGALAGAIAGTRVSAGASEAALRRGFALFLVAVAAWMIARSPIIVG
jgi:hypothetical protein